MHILIVDDDMILRKNFAEILRDKGFFVEVADNGRQGIALFNSNPFDLVILDIKLPDISGIEVFRKMKEISQKPSFMIITAFPYDKLVSELRQKKDIACFSKPFNVNEVVTEVERVAAERH